MELEYFKVDGVMVKCIHPEVVKFHEYGGMAMSKNSKMIHCLVIELKDGTKKEFEGELPFVEADKFLKTKV